MTHFPRIRLAVMGIKGLPSKGGAERVAEALALRLREDFDITVYCRADYAGDHEPDGIRLIKLKTPKGKHLGSMALFILSALHALFIRRFDLIHVHNTDAGFIIPLLKLRYRVVATSHGYPWLRDKWSRPARFLLRISEALFFRFADRITCVSRSISDELASSRSKPVQFIPNGIDPPVADASLSRPILEEHGLMPGSFLCFAAGRVDPTKGCHTFLEALSRQDTPLPAAVVGDFSHKPDYTERLHRMAGDRVAFIPFISRRETLFGLLQSALLFVFPSTVEAMSVLLLEVAALGIPMICSDIPENVCVLGDRTIYFKAGDAGDLERSIRDCLEDMSRIRRLAAETRGWILETYSWEGISKQYKNLYNSFFPMPRQEI